MDSSLIAAFCGLGGVLVGALASSLTTYIVQRQETKRKLTDMLIQAAVTNWCKAQESAKEMKLPLPPLDVFIINLVQLTDILEKRQHLSDTELISLMTENLERTETICDAVQARSFRPSSGRKNP